MEKKESKHAGVLYPNMDHAEKFIEELDPSGIKQPYCGYFHDNIRLTYFINSVLTSEKIESDSERSAFMEKLFLKDQKLTEEYFKKMGSEFRHVIRKNNMQLVSNIEDPSLRNDLINSQEFDNMVDSIYWWNIEIEKIQTLINQSSLYLCQLHNLTSKFSNLEKNQTPEVAYGKFDYVRMIAKESISCALKYGGKLSTFKFQGFWRSTTSKMHLLFFFNLWFGWNLPVWMYNQNANMIGMLLVSNLIPAFTSERLFQKMSQYFKYSDFKDYFVMMSDTFRGSARDLQDLRALIEADFMNSLKSIGDDELQGKFEENMKFHVNLLYTKREKQQEYLKLEQEMKGVEMIDLGNSWNQIDDGKTPKEFAVDDEDLVMAEKAGEDGVYILGMRDGDSEDNLAQKLQNYLEKIDKPNE